MQMNLSVVIGKVVYLRTRNARGRPLRSPRRSPRPAIRRAAKGV